MIIIIQNHTTRWLSQTLEQPGECSHVLEEDRREDNLQEEKGLEREELEEGGREASPQPSSAGRGYITSLQPSLGSPAAGLLPKPQGLWLPGKESLGLRFSPT